MRLFAVLLVLLNCLTESTFPSPSSYSNTSVLLKKIPQILWGGGGGGGGGGKGGTQVGGGGGGGH